MGPGAMRQVSSVAMVATDPSAYSSRIWRWFSAVQNHTARIRAAETGWTEYLHAVGQLDAHGVFTPPQRIRDVT